MFTGCSESLCQSVLVMEEHFMCDRMQIFNSDELNLIHHSSMEILKDTGVRFIAEAALDIFRHHGFKTDGTRVFFAVSLRQTCMNSNKIYVTIGYLTIQKRITDEAEKLPTPTPDYQRSQRAI
jgi:trimethylamine:corrinoid methyltransferase-like protein